MQIEALEETYLKQWFLSSLSCVLPEDAGAFDLGDWDVRLRCSTLPHLSRLEGKKVWIVLDLFAVGNAVLCSCSHCSFIPVYRVKNKLLSKDKIGGDRCQIRCFIYVCMRHANMFNRNLLEDLESTVYFRCLSWCFFQGPTKMSVSC